MKIFTKVLLLTFLATPLVAQNELIIEPGTSENPVFINSIIHADTLADGTRNQDRVYVLRRNGLYFISQELNIKANKLHIKAEDGEGFRPFIAPFPNETGVYPRMFRVAGDLVLEGLHWNNVNGEAYKWGGNANTGSGSRIEIRDCFIERDGGAGWMANGKKCSFLFENCVIGNMGAPKKLGGNGRLIDTRGNETDTIIIRHCTIYLLSDRILRNLGGVLNYFEFDHNTVFNVLGRHGAFTLGRTKNLKITNNLMINPLYMGNHPGTQEQSHPDKENFYVIAMDTAYSGIFEIHHNNITFTKAVKDYYATNDSVSEPGVLEPLVASTLGTDASKAFITEEIAFTKVPPFPMDYLVSIFANPKADFHPDNFDVTVGMPLIDASYPTTSLSFKSDVRGMPLGSHQWWAPEQLVGISKNKTSNSFDLNVYPNPASEKVQLGFQLEKSAPIKISVYDMQGRMVISHNEVCRSVGYNIITLPVNSLASGVYMLHLNNGMQSSIRQLMVE